MRILRSRLAAELPVLGPVEDIARASVTVFGQLVVLVTPRGAADLSRAQVYVHDGDQSWYSVQLASPGCTYPLVEMLADGEILVVAARCRRFRDGTAEDNAHVYDSLGVHLRSFCLGDGIEHVGVDAAGTIWVGYFDDGVFGNRGWNDPVGAAGLVRFDRHGQRLWTYDPPSGAEAIADCYALNVDARTTWVCYYTDFPLVRIADGRAHAYAPTPVRGARGLSTYRDEVIFIGDYQDRLGLADCRLVRGSVEYRDRAVLHDPEGNPVHLFNLIAARGSRLHVRTDRRIFCAELADEINRSP